VRLRVGEIMRGEGEEEGGRAGGKEDGNGGEEKFE
jgi:hypothetical protein